MGVTYAIAGHLPFRWGMWHEDHDPGDGHGPRPGHVIYQAMPGETVHEGWLEGLDDRIGRMIHQGILTPGAKTKDSPASPPAEMVRSFTEGTAATAPDGHPLRERSDAGEPVPALEPATTPDPEPVQAADPDDTESHVEPAPEPPAEG